VDLVFNFNLLSGKLKNNKSKISCKSCLIPNVKIESMPKKYFTIELPDGSQIHVFFETASGIIVNFVVKLVIKYNSR